MNILINFVLIGIIRLGSAQLCEQELKKQYLIPDVFKSCDYDLEVVYNGNIMLNCGDYISFYQTARTPLLKLNVLKKCKYVTLVLFDPDLYIMQGFVHWIVHNIPSSQIENGWGEGNMGDTKFSYVPPMVPIDSHRYVFLLFCQKNKIVVEPENKYESGAKRMFFNVTQFQLKHKFQNPLACNFMEVTLT